MLPPESGGPQDFERIANVKHDTQQNEVKAGHTAGPLDYHVGEDYAVVMAPGRNTENPLARIYSDSPEADCALFASSPDLLAAAHRAIAALAANGAPNCEAVKELRAAILKAEGRGGH